MLELVPDCSPDPAGFTQPAAEPGARPSATIHYIYDPFNAPRMINAISSVAKRLQDALLEFDAIPEGTPLPFPYLASSQPD